MVKKKNGKEKETRTNKRQEAVVSYARSHDRRTRSMNIVTVIQLTWPSQISGDVIPA